MWGGTLHVSLQCVTEGFQLLCVRRHVCHPCFQEHDAIKKTQPCAHSSARCIPLHARSPARQPDERASELAMERTSARNNHLSTDKVQSLEKRVDHLLAYFRQNVTLDASALPMDEQQSVMQLLQCVRHPPPESCSAMVCKPLHVVRESGSSVWFEFYLEVHPRRYFKQHIEHSLEHGAPGPEQSCDSTWLPLFSVNEDGQM